MSSLNTVGKMALVFVDVNTELPEPNRDILIRFEKKSKSARLGKTGTFLTQGVLQKYESPFVTGTLHWYDYTNRLLCTHDSKKKSPNTVIEWAYL